VESSRNPIRLLLRLPVPWVFVLVYLIGAGAERAWPTHFIEHVWHPGVAGGIALDIGVASRAIAPRFQLSDREAVFATAAAVVGKILSATRLAPTPPTRH
jgi:hypothetical protein